MRRSSVLQAYLLAVIMALSFVAYMSFTKPMPTRAPDEQKILYSKVPIAQPGPPPVATPVEYGEALAYMEIPRFGEDWLWTTLEGASIDVLDLGPGHFEDTALPGADGNSAYAAHRSGHGDPLLDFELLRKGDEIILSQGGATWTYRVVFQPRIIEETEGWVLDQTPRWGKRFNKPRLTLVTCWPKYGSEKRMYVRAILIDAKS